MITPKHVGSPPLPSRSACSAPVPPGLPIPPALDQKTVDELMGKARQTEPAAPDAAIVQPAATPPVTPPAVLTPPAAESATPPAVLTPPAAESATPPARLGDALWDLVQGSEPLTVTADQTSHRVGERLTLTMTIPRAGYLNILGVDPNDQAKVLYPNKYIPDNRVEPGPLTFPPPNMPVAFKAQEPVGKTRLFALLSEKPLNLYTECPQVRQCGSETGRSGRRTAPRGIDAADRPDCPRQGPSAH